MNPEPCDFDRIAREELPQAQRIALWMTIHHPDARILDVGCGPGLYVEEMRKKGRAAFGVDGDERLVEKPYLWRADLEFDNPTWRPDRIPQFFDIALSLEVGEHIPEAGADAYVNFLASTRAAVVYFSAARPGQGGEGHIHLQPKAYWVEKMHRAGFWLDPDATERWLGFMRNGPHLGWITQNGMVFRRG